MAYMTIVVPDTGTMEIGSAMVFPETPSTGEWMTDILSDITVLYDKSEAKAKEKVVAKARRRVVDPILAVPRGDRPLVAADRSIPRVLEALYEGLARQDGYIDHDSGWIAFNSHDAYIEAELKRGQDPFTVISVDAYLLSVDDKRPTEAEVLDWIAQQPMPVLGVLTSGSQEREDGTVEYLPVFTVELHPDGVMSEFVQELLSPFVEAWDNRSVATGTEQLEFDPDDGLPYRVRDAVDIEPRNAWLLIGSESSFLSSIRLAETWRAAEGGVYDGMWTAPKNGELGDLVVVYYTAPRKAAHFVARMASHPFWQEDMEVADDKVVDPHQWWAWVTPFIEIEPIPYATLREAANGHLMLKGRSGHYLAADVISRLSFSAADPSQQAQLDRVVRGPVGLPDLPDLAAITFEQWARINPGLLVLEAQVSDYVVAPLQAISATTPQTRLPDPYRLEREHRVPSGYIDFVIRWGDLPPLAAIEVKLAIKRPITGVWADSPDFRQLLRYMRDLNAPGILVDSRSILLVKAGADAPHAEITRSEATWSDMAQIADLLGEALESARRSSD